MPAKPGLPQAIPLGAGFGGVASLFGLIFWPVVIAAMGSLIALDFPSWSPTDVCKQELLCYLYPATLAPPGLLPTIDGPACIDGCDICVKVCPKGPLDLNMDSKAFLTDIEGCISCYACVQQCPVNAIS